MTCEYNELPAISVSGTYSFFPRTLVQLSLVIGTSAEEIGFSHLLVSIGHNGLASES